MATNELKILLTGDASRLSSSLKSASSKLKSFGSKISSVGASMQRFALPLAVAGGAAIKMAVDFDKSMTQIKTLVGVAGDEVDKMGEQVKKLASQAGISSNEAAKALFYITSAGLRGAEAMDVLNASLKASAVGLGDTATVADLATSAMNAYGSNVLSATGATDVLVAAVREGKLESSELSAVMGQILPTASNMGVKFYEVGAAFAAMSRTGTNASQAATQLNGILMAIMKPTTASANAMQLLGLSSAGLRKQIKEDGLLSVLQTLKEASDKNSTAFEQVFGNVRALKGVLDLTGAGAEQAAEIFNRMANTVGMTDGAFEKLQESASFKLQKSLVELKNLFTDLGGTLLSTLLPVFQKIAGVLKGVFTWFSGLSDKTKTWIIALGGLLTILPTIISIVGGLVTVLGAIISPAGLVIAALAGIAYVVYKNWGVVRKSLVDIANYFIDLYNESFAFRLIVESIPGYFSALWQSAKNTFSVLWNFIKNFGSNLVEMFKGVGKFLKGVFTLDTDLIAEGFKQAGNAAMKNLGDALKAGTDIVVGNYEIMFKEAAKTIERARKATPIEFVTEDDLQNGINSLLDPIKNFGKMLGFGINSGISETESPFTKIEEDLTTSSEAIAQQAVSLGQRITDAFSNMGLSIDEVMFGVSSAFLGAFEAMLSGENFFKVLIDGLKQLIVKLMAAAATALLLSVLLKSIGIGSIGGGGADFKSLFGAFSGFGPKLVPNANGGIYSGPTAALVGEYPGAKANPEVIAPLNKLKNMMGGTSSTDKIELVGSTSIKGEDILIAYKRAEKNKNRTS